MKRLLIVCCAAFALMLAGCAKKAETAVSENKTHIVVDHKGNEVELPVNIERVVIISPMPLPSIYCLYMGGTDKLVGMHPTSMAAAENSYLKNVYPDVVNVPTGFVKNGAVNVEELLKLKPDVVFYLASDKALEESLQNAGIKGFAFSTSVADFNTIETYANWIGKFGEIFGDTGRADSIIKHGREVEKFISARLANLKDEEKPSVLMLYNYDTSGMKTSGVNFYGDYWINAGGGKNVACELKGSPAISMEQVYQWNPEYIFITNFSPYLPEDLYNNSIDGYDWSQIDAVKNKRVYKFPLGMYRWYPPSSDTPLALKWISKTLHPELFADMDMDKEVTEYFKEFYGANLTAEDLNAIFNPVREASGK
ncbi:MAG: ABC transporter substrate-binding protein [Spirochaetaceae bacterium]|nr:ABC transporter substrate-binding protein [Spirochaetaceae bacterium]